MLAPPGARGQARSKLQSGSEGGNLISPEEHPQPRKDYRAGLASAKNHWWVLPRPMMLKTAAEIAQMCAAGRGAAQVAAAMADAVRAGVTTLQLDQLAARSLFASDVPSAGVDLIVVHSKALTRHRRVED